MTSYFLALKSACARLTKVATAEAQSRAGVYGAQAQALLILSRLEACKIIELAKQLDLGKPAATTLVARMEKADLVCRKPDPDDGRASVLHLTSKGRMALKDVKLMISAFDQRLTNDFNERELAVVSRFLAQAVLLDNSEKGS